MSILVFFFLVCMLKFVLEYDCFPFVKVIFSPSKTTNAKTDCNSYNLRNTEKRVDHVNDGGTKLKEI